MDTKWGKSYDTSQAMLLIQVLWFDWTYFCAVWPRQLWQLAEASFTNKAPVFVEGSHTVGH
jgi:hypothetical protein